ncbi:MAG: MBL fold metallo-hydrolase [Myxococcota bacterium]|nr:MBL fold metallo-hydrolase [Myxococcota bacterium]
MSFEELLQRRLGPMKDLISSKKPVLTREYDISQLFFRRADGLELFFHPEESKKQLKVEIPNRSPVTLDFAEAVELVSHHEWVSSQQITKTQQKKYWKWAQAGLMYFAQNQPASPSVWPRNTKTNREKLRWHEGAWFNLALEDLVQIGPIPFMPRKSDLEHSQIVGARFSLQTRDVEILGLTVTGSKSLGSKIQSLIPAIDGQRDRGELEALLGESASGLVSLLLEFGFLVPDEQSEAETALDSFESQVTWLGHAAVLYQSRGKNILIDPLFFRRSFPESRRFRDRPFDPTSLPKIDMVLITHADNDHLNPTSLAWLPRETKIVIPKLTDPPKPYHVDIEGLLSRLGFFNVIQVGDWSNLRVDEITVTACPFIGEDWGLDLPKQTYLIYSDELCIYCSADSYRMPDVFEKLSETRPVVDVAFFGVSGCSEPYAVDARFGYGNFYRDWIPAFQQNEWTNHCMGPRDAYEMLKFLKPRNVFGYASGGADYIETSFSDEGSHEALKELMSKSDEARPIDFVIGQPVLASLIRGLI